jgi:Chromo (CHRromatin Organisation MOdifier) domain
MGDRNDAMTSHFRVGARREMIWSLATVLERMPQWYPGYHPKIHLFGDYAPVEGEELPTFLSQHFQPLLCDWKAFLDPFMHNISGYVQNDAGASEKSLHVWSIDADGYFKARRLASNVMGDAGGWSDLIPVLRSMPEDGAVPERLFFSDCRNNLVGKVKMAYVDIAQGVIDKFGLSMPDKDREWWENFRNSMSNTKQPIPTVAQKAPTTRRAHRDVKMDDKPIIRQTVPRQKKVGTASAGDSDDNHDDSGAVDDAMDGDDPEYRVEAIIGRKTGEDGDVLYHVRWAKPYNDETWEPLSHLANAMRLVDDFERVWSGAKSGLSASGLAHADLARELREQAEREAKESMVACKFCHRMFKKKGVKTHERSCPRKPKE